MKVVLSSDVDTLGRKGEVVDVAAGYARNFLLPRKLAIVATKGAVRQSESMVRAREERDRQEREAFAALSERITSLKISIAAKVGSEGHLFGSVTSQDLADELTRLLGEEIDRRKIELPEPIRTLGTHEFSVQLAREVVATATVEVVAESDPGAPPAERTGSETS